MANKEQEMNEIHKGIWQIANDLRGAVDGWDFKSYVLGTLFYKYISENLTNWLNENERESNKDFDYAKLEDNVINDATKNDIINSKGFFIYPSQLFCNIIKTCESDENLNINIANIFKAIEDSTKGTKSEKAFRGLFDDYDTNSNKLGGTVKERNKRLCSLLKGIDKMNLGEHKDNSVDAFGDAYEYLMGMYASNAGKSGGEYFTPQEVSELLTKICILDKKEINKIYDPACYDDITKVYTKRGWVLFADLLDDDMIYSLNPTTGNAEWVRFVARQTYDYDGELIGFDSKQLQLLVTPDHKMVNVPRTYGTKQNINNKIYFSTMKETEEFILRNNKIRQVVSAKLEINENKKVFKSVEFAKLFGFFLGDGYTRVNKSNKQVSSVIFHIKKSRKVEFLKECCKTIGIELFELKNNRYRISDKSFIELVSNFGHITAIDKYIPNEIFEETLENRLGVLIGLQNSDGHTTSTNLVRYECVSELLRNDIERLAITCGFRVRTSERTCIMPSQSTNKPIKTTLYGVNWRIGTYATIHPKNLYRKHYVGKVYDITLEYNHCMLIKRNGCIQFSGNCGSGSLLLKAAKILDLDKIRNGFYGQEKNITTKNLATINMFLHGIDYDKFDIALGDTLIDPKHWDDEPFDVIVSNPPYSIPWEGNKNPTLITDERFSPAGILAPNGKADLAFIMHSLSWLAEGGTAAIVCFPGIFYRGGAEQKIRKYLIDNNYIDAIIQLPENLFYGTSISTCIMVMKKGKKDNNVKFIDASKEFVKITNSNMLTKENINNILKYYKDNKDVQYIVKIVSHDDIEKEKYNLSVSTYVEKEDTREKVNIKELNKKIEKIVANEEVLRNKINEIIQNLEN